MEFPLSTANPNVCSYWGGGGNLYIKCNKMEAKPINVKYVVGVP